jgi:hypothetical protein
MKVAYENKRSLVRISALVIAVIAAFVFPIDNITAKPAANAPAKPSAIYGTPAQLVEDLRAIGIDLVKDEFTKQEVLTRTPHTTNPVYCEYHFANAMVLIRRAENSIESGQITAPGVEPFTTYKPVVKGAAMDLGALGKAITSGREAIKARYGTEYLEVLPPSERERIDAWMHYVVLIKGKTTSMWNLSFGFDKAGKFHDFVLGTPCEDVAKVRVTGLGEGAKVVSEDMPLYEDLMDIGFNVGMKTSRPDVLQLAKPGGKDEYRGTDKLLFLNAEVSMYPSGVIESVLLNPHHESGWKGTVDRFHRRMFEREVDVPKNTILETMAEGRGAILARYGTANGAGSSTESSSYPDIEKFYYLAVTDESRTFIVFATFGRSLPQEFYFSAVGYSFPAFVYTPPAKGKGR